MKNMNKKITIGIIVTLIVCALVGSIIYINNKRKYNEIVKTAGIKSIEEIKYDLPKFTILVAGIYEGTISTGDVKKLKTYKFEAVTDDGLEKELHTYIGIKVLDVLNRVEFKKYNHITFMSTGDLQVKYDTKEITENMYFVFEKDGKKYPKAEEVTLINPDVNSRYNLTCIVKMLVD